MKTMVCTKISIKKQKKMGFFLQKWIKIIVEREIEPQKQKPTSDLMHNLSSRNKKDEIFLTKMDQIPSRERNWSWKQKPTSDLMQDFYEETKKDEIFLTKMDQNHCRERNWASKTKTHLRFDAKIWFSKEKQEKKVLIWFYFWVKFEVMALVAFGVNYWHSLKRRGCRQDTIIRRTLQWVEERERKKERKKEESLR